MAAELNADVGTLDALVTDDFRLVGPLGFVLDNSNAPIAGVTVRALLTNVLHSNLGAAQTAPAPTRVVQPEEIVERVFDFFAHNCIAIVTVCHDIHVNVAVPGMTETGDWKSILSL